MARYRKPWICEDCGKEIKAKYRDQSHLPTQLMLIGDTFEGYDMDTHKDCNVYGIKNRKKLIKP
jgi:hypothetical protein